MSGALRWTPGYRIIRTIYPPVDLFEDIADPADWERKLWGVVLRRLVSRTRRDRSPFQRFMRATGEPPSDADYRVLTWPVTAQVEEAPETCVGKDDWRPGQRFGREVR